MKSFSTLLIPALFAFVLLRVIAMPIRWFWKIFINSACGFLCLFLLNSVSGFTGIYFPINYVTVAISGFLGLPGIGAMALIQYLL